MNYQTYFQSEIASYQPMVDSRQMMELYGCKTKKTVYKILATGKIEYIIVKGQYMISRDDILKYRYECKHLKDDTTEYVISLREYYEELFAKYPDTLNVKDVGKLTGYVKTSIQRWILQGILEAFKIEYEYVIPKECLINFMVSTRYRSIHTKCELHKRQLEEFESEVL